MISVHVVTDTMCAHVYSYDKSVHAALTVESDDT